MIYYVENDKGFDVTNNKNWVLSPDGDLLYFCEMTGEVTKASSEYNYYLLKDD